MHQSDHNDLQRFVDRLTARSALSREEREAILDLPAQTVRMQRKQDFVRMDEDTSHAYLVVSGLVGRFSQTSEGARQITAFHIPGDMIDLQSAIRPVGVGGLNAVSDTIVLRIPHGAIRKLAARFPAVAEAFWRDCLLDAAVLMQWVLNVGRRDARTRLAHILCEMATRFTENGVVPMRYTFSVTQEHIADATAMTPVHVNRSLKTLRQDRLVTISSGNVTIHDWAGLIRAGDFDGAYLTADVEAEPRERAVA